MYKIGLVLPTLNAVSFLNGWYEGLSSQNIKLNRLLIVDSSSTDGTKEIAELLGIQVHSIPQNNFDHGATRQLAVELLGDLDFIIFMTQDVKFFDNETLENILSIFSDCRIGLAYGKQLPHKGEKPFGVHARLYNYSDEFEIRSMETISKYKSRSIFCSNSFACYRLTALQEIGGFPGESILSEDLYVAGKLILANWKVAYIPSARVYHSHTYGILEEAKRYFDLGVFYSSNTWISANFGKNESQGFKFLASELKYIFANHPFLLPLVLIRNFSKYLFFKIGSFHKLLPLFIICYLTKNKTYFLRIKDAKK